MAEYVYIEDGVIEEYHGGLPQSWRHISGLYLLKDDPEYLLSIGWYPVTKVFMEYDAATERVVGYTYEIFSNYVTETPVVEAIPGGQVKPFSAQKSEFLESLRQQRNIKLRDSDWTQLLDCVLSTEDIEQWRIYRQELRDLPQVYAYNSVTDISNVNWPTIPTGV